MSNRWHSIQDPLLHQLWQEYRDRTSDEEMEVIVMINGGRIPTAAYYDGGGFYHGIDPIPVTAWRPFPPAPGDEKRLVDADLLIEECKHFFHTLIDAGEENVEVTDFNVRFQDMIKAACGQYDGKENRK